MSAEVGGGAAPVVLWRWDSEWPADTAEFCPMPPYRHLLLSGTYRLREDQPADIPPEECQRDGRLHLLDCGRRRELQRLDTAAVLDVKWSPAPVGGRPLVAAADARGRLLLFRLTDAETGPRLEPVANRAVAEPGRLALALEWCALAAGTARLAVSDSSGAVTVLQLAEDGRELTVLWTNVCHGHEAWTCGFKHSDGNVVYTGGDDLLFRGYDIRLDPACPVFTNRSHEAGVTSVQSDYLTEHTLRTGSYDEHLYVWDDRAMRRPLERAPLSGGVWRIKRHPRRADHVLTACMYGGSHVTDAAGTVMASFLEHKSIVYGADWCQLDGGGGWEERVDRTPVTNDSAGAGGDAGDDAAGDGGDVVNGDGDTERHRESSSGDTSVAVTCSFYDHLLCLWEI
ncbi:diphthine methyltransferase-like [Amphibalanus amphitrite]|uniref:diphthine methyltransferase-like n=1 Tax=Amphibalanus amphitrite TaxID=1232801 RepID=UPI001C8FCED7|nr:diphthine methyltransferase-like [Amphibalanus amphitrite]